MDAASPINQPPITFRYIFTFPDGRQDVFVIQLDGNTVDLLQEPQKELPEWTRLGVSQCPNCPLAEQEHPRCPAAVSLVGIVERFGRSLSIEQVEVRLETEARTFVKRASLQEAVSSLIGLYMVTSGCPIMGKLKPMARYHLPFSTLEETRYRVLSMYLLAQYFIAKRGRSPDWEFKELIRLYEEIQTVNSHFFKRLAQTDVEDASLNAIVRLDAFAGSIAFTVDQQLLEELERLFRSYGV